MDVSLTRRAATIGPVEPPSASIVVSICGAYVEMGTGRIVDRFGPIPDLWHRHETVAVDFHGAILDTPIIRV